MDTLLNCLEESKESLTDASYKEAIEILKELKDSETLYDVEIYYSMYDLKIDNRCSELFGSSQHFMINPTMNYERYKSIKVDSEFFEGFDESNDIIDVLVESDFDTVQDYIYRPNKMSKNLENTPGVGNTEVIDSRADIGTFDKNHFKVFVQNDQVLVRLKKI